MENHETRGSFSPAAKLSTRRSERACRDQCFELASGIYIAMALMFAGFVAVLASAFRGGHMAVAYGVIFGFIAAFFAVPAHFRAGRARRAQQGAAAGSILRDRGIMTATGHSSAREATILVLLLPFLILCFAIAVATIAALN